MIKKCPSCGGRVLTASMTAEEEQTYAAAFRCLSCGKRYLEPWPSPERAHVPVDEK